MQYIDEFIGSGGRWKRQVLTTGSWTAPIDGTYYLNGVAAGAAGRTGTDTTDRPGGGAGESVSMMPVYLSAGTVVSAAIGAGGTGDGAAGNNTTFGSYLTLYGGGKAASAGDNFYGGGTFNADGNRSTFDARFISADKKPGANATSTGGTTGISTHANFLNGAKAGTYMWGGAGSKYGAGGAGNASGAGAAGGLGAGGGSGTTAAGPGGDGYLEIMWQE